MSLLLDALRRAEEARRAKEADGNAVQVDNNVAAGNTARPQPAPVLHPHAAPAIDRAVTAEESIEEANELAPATSLRNDLALEELPSPIVDSPPAEAPFAVTAKAQNTLPTTTLKDATQREVARNVFAAKQSGVPLADDPDKRKWIVPVVAAILAVVGAGGWYVWNEINRVSPPMVARSTLPPAALPSATPNIGQIGNKPASTPEMKATKADALVPPPLLPPQLSAVAATSLQKMPVLPSSASEKTLTAREALAKNFKEAAVAKEAPAGLKLARSVAPPKLNPELASAYQLLANGNYAAAQKLYTKLVVAEPLNIDAQLGLATAAARGGDRALALQHYRQVLALDPRNGLAIMGMVALNDGGQSTPLEIEMKTLIGRNPDAAPLHFALGNIYANEQRWTEAQQAYFEAFRIDSANPDYLFNLAVSLDQLRQTRLALDYYRKAEAIVVAKGGGQFDRTTIARRIRELSGDTGRSN